MPKSKQRNDEALNIRAKISNNVCPICWMPLFSGAGEAAKRWHAVQMAFKVKPAFSIRNPPPGRGEVGRAIKVFGVSPLTGYRIANCEQCHYVHFSMLGEYSDLNNLWYCNLKNNEKELVKTSSFLIEFVRIKVFFPVRWT